MLLSEFKKRIINSIDKEFNEAIKQLKLIIIDKKLKFVSLGKWLNSISAT